MGATRPVFLRLRSSKWFIAITIFAAIFTVGWTNLPPIPNVFYSESGDEGAKIANWPSMIFFHRMVLSMALWVEWMDGRVAEVSYFLYVCAWLVMGVDVLIFRMQIVPVTPFALVDRIGIPQKDGLDKPLSPPPPPPPNNKLGHLYIHSPILVGSLLGPLRWFGPDCISWVVAAPWRRKEVSFSLKKEEKKRIPRVDVE